MGTSGKSRRYKKMIAYRLLVPKTYLEKIDSIALAMNLSRAEIVRQIIGDFLGKRYYPDGLKDKSVE